MFSRNKKKEIEKNQQEFYRGYYAGFKEATYIAKEYGLGKLLDRYYEGEEMIRRIARAKDA